MDCLFQDVSNQCGGIKSEHLLQKCIGGTWEDDDVICAKCNEYFSKEIDRKLCNTFELLMCVLAPLLSGDIKNKIIKVESNEGVSVQIAAGGVVGIAKTKTIQSKDGPRVYSHLESEAKAAAKVQTWPFGQYEGRKLPVSELVTLPPKQIVYDLDFYRAIMKCLVEVLDKVSRRDKGITFARRPELLAIRRFVRNGTIGGPIAWHFLPIFRLEDELQHLFLSNFEFSNRVAIFFDNRRGKLFGLVQIANTIPLGGYLSTGLDWPEASFSFLYEKSLTRRRGSNANEKWLPYCAIDERKYNFRQFAVSSRESADFAWHSVTQSICDQIGRAYAVADINSDFALLGSMIVQYEHLIGNESVPPGEAAITLIETILRRRYQGKNVPEKRWRILRLELCALLKAQSYYVYELFRRNKDFGDAAHELVSTYRAQLTKLIDEFGFPVGSSPAT